MLRLESASEIVSKVIYSIRIKGKGKMTKFAITVRRI